MPQEPNTPAPSSMTSERLTENPSVTGAAIFNEAGQLVDRLLRIAGPRKEDSPQTFFGMVSQAIDTMELQLAEIKRLEAELSRLQQDLDTSTSAHLTAALDWANECADSKRLHEENHALQAELSRRPTPEQLTDTLRSALMPLSGYEATEAGYALMLKAKQYNLIIHDLAAKLNLSL